MNDLSSSFFAALSEALLASLWQGAIIGVAAAASLRLMRKSTPHARYLIACAALVSCVVLPILTFFSALVAEDGMGSEAIRASWQWAIMTVDGKAPGRAPVHEWNWAPYLVWSWFAGCLLLLGRTAAATAWLEREVRKPQPASQRVWQLRIDSLAARQGVTQPVRLLLTSSLTSPAVARIAHPVVFLPTAVTTRMPVEWIKALLAHELAHIRRHDYLVNLAQKFIEAVLFHQPAVWWLSSRIRHERELIADSIAVEAGVDRRTLAAALGELVELQDAAAPSRLPDIALSARGGRLMSRIQSLIRPTAPVAIGHSAIPAIALLAIAVTVSAGTSSETPAKHAAARAEPAAAVRPAQAAIPSVPAAQMGPALGASTVLATAQEAQAVSAPKTMQPMDEFVFVRDGRQGPSIITHGNAATSVGVLGQQGEAPGGQMAGIVLAHQGEAPKLQARLAPLERLSRKMDEVSRPMAALGTRPAERGTRQAQLAEETAQTIDDLEAALAKGWTSLRCNPRCADGDRFRGRTP